MSLAAHTHKYHSGQTLIDYASGDTNIDEKTVTSLMSTSAVKFHRRAVICAIMCDNVNAIRSILSYNNVNMCHMVAAVEYCAHDQQPAYKPLPDILMMSSETITMTCVEYNAIKCFKYLHKITQENYDVVISKAVKYGATAILTHLAANPDLNTGIITAARRRGLVLKIYPIAEPKN
jgi:hypothetical protein